MGGVGRNRSDQSDHSWRVRKFSPFSHVQRVKKLYTQACNQIRRNYSAQLFFQRETHYSLPRRGSE